MYFSKIERTIFIYFWKNTLAKISINTTFGLDYFLLLIYKMNKFMEMFFTPLGREWCLYYYILMVIAFLGFLMTCVTGVVSLVGSKKFTVSGFFKNSFLPVLTSFVVYLLSRLAYSICEGALKQ